MPTLPETVSLIYYCTGVLYFFLGLSIMFSYPKGKANRMFFLITLSLCVWSLAFSFRNIAPTEYLARFWGKIGAFGWGTCYTLFLHYILIVVHKDTYLQKKIHLFLFYLPALLTVYFFALSTNASSQYIFTSTPIGWTTAYARTGGRLPYSVHFFNLYYISYFVIGMRSLIQFLHTTPDKRAKSQFIPVLVSLLGVFIIGSFFDKVLLDFYSVVLPKVTIIGIFLPVSIIFFSLKKYGLIKPSSFESTTNGNLLNISSVRTVYLYIVAFYFFSGFVNFAAWFFFLRWSLISAGICGLLFISNGLLLLAVLKFSVSEIQREIWSTVIFCLSILEVAYYFLPHAGITVWAFPATLLLFSILLNRSFTIIAVSLTATFSQVFTFIVIPHSFVRIDDGHHLLRIALISFSFFIAYLVNQLYLKHLNDNTKQLQFQETLSNISSLLVNADRINLPEKVNGILRYLLDYSDLQRGHLFYFSHDQKFILLSNECYQHPLSTTKEFNIKVPVQDYLWWTNRLLAGEVINLPDISEIPDEAHPLRHEFLDQNNSSIIALPLYQKNKVVGFLEFESMNPIDIDEKCGEILRVVCGLLSTTLEKIDTVENINFMAYYDPLTNLPNRTLFNKQLSTYIDFAQKDENFLGILSMDIDNFQYVNDTLGHQQGDQLLVFLSEKLSQATISHGLVSRFDGDEFGILIFGTPDVESIEQIVQKIMAIFQEPIVMMAREFFVRASIGVAIYPIDGEDGDTLLQNATMTMHESKKKGKNQYNFCSAGMKERLFEKMELTKSLHSALEKHELVLYYQPQVSTYDQTITGFEALLRWNRPHGMISPGIFIPLSEQTGLIKPIGRWVLHEAARQINDWNRQFHTSYRMAVNLSIQQLKDPHFSQFIHEVLSKNNLDSKFLEVEITESLDLEENLEILKVLDEIQGLGVPISIDDFGTKYSSLSRLKNLPIDRMKIDMQFIHGIGTNSKDRGITKSIIELAKNLNLNVIAEGVETEEQLDFLLENQCDEIQGYYFYRPMPAEEVTALLKEINQ